jgi:ketosteroid isomerase-like protein
VSFALFHPDVESIWDQKLVALGFKPVARGLPARLDAQRQWEAEWGRLQLDPEELIDLGDSRVLVLLRVKGSGLISGAPIDNECAYLYSISAGRVIREQIFLDHADAFEAAGLREERLFRDFPSAWGTGHSAVSKPAFRVPHGLVGAQRDVALRSRSCQAKKRGRRAVRARRLVCRPWQRCCWSARVRSCGCA